MFSTNPFTRRRQQLATGLTVVSGITLALLVVSGLRLRVGHRSDAITVPKASFGHVALSPDGTRQVEFKGNRVILRDHNTQQPIAVFDSNNIQGVRFTPGGSDVLIHVLQKSNQPGQELAQLTDQVVVLDPISGKKKGEGPYTITR